MGKYEKLIERFLTIPADFTWDELVKLLSYFGYTELTTGKTSGSRRRFLSKEQNIILLHKPHPARIIKKYMLRQVLQHLIEKGKIKND